ncbi:hypothetical protein [Faucicola boevrei]|uniref:hypothetical protein n=1 Tax=Faucicola boevrei TaxID=346665 RepID=UPI000369174F|nr:hypothetical protein [Moraxella boevrei]
MITTKSTLLTQELINELVDILKSHSLKLNNDNGLAQQFAYNLYVMAEVFLPSCQGERYYKDNARSRLFLFWLVNFMDGSTDVPRFFEQLFDLPFLKIYIAHIIIDFWVDCALVDDLMEGTKNSLKPIYDTANEYLMRLRDEHIHFDDVVIVSLLKN